MASDLPRENIFAPKISYLPFVCSVSRICVASPASNSHVPYITHKSVSEDDTVVLSLFAVIFLMCLLRTQTDFVLSPLFFLCMAPITMFVYDNNGGKPS